MNMNGVFFLCSSAETPDGGIYTVKIENGSCRELAFQQLPGVNFLCGSNDGKYLYATFNRGKTGYAGAFSVNSDSSLNFLNEEPANGGSACHLTCSPDGRFLFNANYAPGGVSVYRLDECGGHILKRLKTLRFEASEPHSHCTAITPDKKYLCVANLGMDAIFVYRLNSETGIDEEPFSIHKCAASSGPRHIAFDKSGKFAYLSNELDSTVTALRYADGAFAEMNSYQTAPKDFTAKNYPGAVKISPDGRFLFVSNRGHDSIVRFSIRDGVLSEPFFTPCGGIFPRDIAFLGRGEYFASGNQKSNDAVFFRYSEHDGVLAQLSETPPVKSRSPIAFFQFE